MLMTAHARQGNRAAVKKQYQKLEIVLKEELFLSPSAAIRDLYSELIG